MIPSQIRGTVCHTNKLIVVHLHFPFSFTVMLKKWVPPLPCDVPLLQDCILLWCSWLWRQTGCFYLVLFSILKPAPTPVFTVSIIQQTRKWIARLCVCDLFALCVCDLFVCVHIYLTSVQSLIWKTESLCQVLVSGYATAASLQTASGWIVTPHDTSQCWTRI